MIKILFKVLSLIMRLQGYSSYFASRLVKMLWEDFFQNKDTTLEQKIWAHKRGFLSDKISFYGLTEDNYIEYLSDFDYYKLHPINGTFSKWIDDKLTFKYILSPYAEFIPEYYYLVNREGITKLMDCPVELGTDKQDIINLIKEKRNLAAKLISGSFAEGFYKLSYNDAFFINNKPVDVNIVKKLISEWQTITGGYILTEYLSTNQELGKIWNKTPNTLRIMTARLNNQESCIVSSFIRFGTKKTGVIDNASIGGVACAVDIEDGRFFNGRTVEKDNMVECRYHPDTKALMEGVLPYWSLIKKTIHDISNYYIPQMKYMGYDVIITDEGFKIIEINSHQGIKFHQYYKPFYKNQLANDFFNQITKNRC